MTAPIPAEQVSAALRLLGIDPQDFLAIHITPEEIRVKQRLRDARGVLVPDLNDHRTSATTTTVHPVGYDAITTTGNGLFEPVETASEVES